MKKRLKVKRDYGVTVYNCSTCRYVTYIFGRSGKGLFHFPRAVHIAETCLLIVSLLLIDVYCGWLLTALFIRK
jgi:hypothetical protein